MVGDGMVPGVAHPAKAGSHTRPIEHTVIEEHVLKDEDKDFGRKYLNFCQFNGQQSGMSSPKVADIVGKIFQERTPEGSQCRELSFI
jgi:hypothetical protein